jgi:hypothetical protein
MNRLISQHEQEELERQWLERAVSAAYPPDRIETGLGNLRREYQHRLWARGEEAAPLRE